MTFDPLYDLRRLTNDFPRIDHSDNTLGHFLTYAAKDVGRRGLAVQEQEVIDLDVGIQVYPLPGRWVKTFALLREGSGPQSYVVLLDANDDPWFLYVDGDTQEIVHTNVRPAGINLTPDEDLYWFAWQTPGGATWYTFIDLLGDGVGELSLTDVQPAGAGTTNTLALRDRYRVPWFISLNNIPEHRHTPFSGTVADLQALDEDTDALILVRPEAWDLIDVNLPPGPPRYATTYHGRLWIYPEPDARYQLDHKYFAMPVVGPASYTLPTAFECLPVFNALSVCFRSQGRLAPSQSVQGMYERLLGYLARLYSPVEQDSQDEEKLPS